MKWLERPNNQMMTAPITASASDSSTLATTLYRIVRFLMRCLKIVHVLLVKLVDSFTRSVLVLTAARKKVTQGVAMLIQLRLLHILTACEFQVLFLQGPPR